jgi:DNA-binding response OmpR family regulator
MALYYLGMARKKNILLVDDDLGVREALVHVLEMEGYQVFQVANSISAIRLFLNNSIDIALLDLGLGNECGWELFRRLMEIRPVLRTIIISGEPEKFDHPLASNAAALMEKPLNLAALFETLNNIALDSTQDRSTQRETSAALAEECVASNDIHRL